MSSSRLFAGMVLSSLCTLLACGGGDGSPSLAEVNGGAPDPVGVRIEPNTAAVETGGTITFAAPVAGDPRAAVTWSVQEGAAGGNITSAGLYTAPSSAGTFHVEARSVADPSKVGRATVLVTAAPSSNAGTGTTYGPSYVSGVTGGGPMPSLAGAPVAACAGDGGTDDTSCLQRALDAAAAAGKPLAIPATAAYYRITAPLIVNTSVLGTGGTPTIRQTSTCSTQQCVGLRLAAGMTGWIYNLHLVGTHSGNDRGEYAHNISVGGVNGVTIKGNVLENPMGDCIGDNAQENDGGVPARNVLIDGNTLIRSARCMISIVNVSDSWAIMNNVLDNPTPWVSPIDIEPWQESSLATNIEVGYNRVDTPANPAETQIGNYLGVVTANAWFDPSPGGNIYVHHNYGYWPFANYVGISSNAGTFTNVVSVSNVQGSTVP